MSEKLAAPERHEALPSPEAHEAIAAHTQTEKHHAEKDPGKLAQEARTAIEETTRSDSHNDPLERLQEAGKASETASPTYINRELKQITLRRELKQIQRKLPAPQRALSKIVHKPAVRVVSEAAGKTVSRPSGLLGGGIVAFIGTSSYLYLANHIGFRYNYLVFIMLFTGGFALGLILELLVNMATSSRRKNRD